MEQLRDKRNRHITYVRFSLTDRCNYRCLYCMPPEGIPLIEHKDIISYEDTLFLLRSFWDMGIQKVRFTGGEVFVRKGFMDFLAQAKKALPEMRFAVTTNGHFLEEYAEKLQKIGIDGVNVSLDTLNQNKFKEITRCGSLVKVLKGIDVACKVKLPLKINTVLMKNFNDDEVLDLLEFAGKKALVLRFIEFMPLDNDVWGRSKFLSSEKIFEILPDTMLWKPLEKDDANAGPARYFLHEKSGQKIGIIAAVSHHFCYTCNRLRITAKGEIKPCLFSETLVSLRDAIALKSPGMVLHAMREALMAKPDTWQNMAAIGHCHMSSIGG